MAIPGIGPLTATAVVASIGSGAEFQKGRSFAAWLGLVPKQESTGGKQKLLSISKRGNHYLRRLLVSGARAVLQCRDKQSPGLSAWLASLHHEFTLTSRLSRWPTRWLASPGRCWPKAKPIGLRCRWSRRRHWPAIDAWHGTPGWKSLCDSHNRRPATTADFQQGFLPGLLANSEMAKWSNPALSKPVTRNSPLRLPN